MSLIKPQVFKRAAMQNLPKIIRRKAARISGIPFVETDQNLPKKTGSNGTCALCPRSEDKRTRNFCDKCNHWVRGKHYSKVFEIENKCRSAPVTFTKGAAVIILSIQ